MSEKKNKQLDVNNLKSDTSTEKIDSLKTYKKTSSVKIKKMKAILKIDPDELD